MNIKKTILIAYSMSLIAVSTAYSAEERIEPGRPIRPMTKLTFKQKYPTFFKTELVSDPFEFAKQINSFLNKAKAEYLNMSQIISPKSQLKELVDKALLETWLKSCTQIFEELTFLIPLLESSDAQNYYYDVLGKSFAKKDSSLEKFTRDPYVSKFFKSPKDVYVFLNNVFPSSVIQWQNLSQSELEQKLESNLDYLTNIKERTPEQDSHLKFLRELHSFFRTKFGKLQYDDYIAGNGTRATTKHFNIRPPEIRKVLLDRAQTLSNDVLMMRGELGALIPKRR